MAELATIARPYAEALFQASTQDTAATAAWLDVLATVAADKQLLQFADNPKVSDGQVLDLMAGVVRLPLPDNAKNFLRTVIENKRLSVLPAIAEQFRGLMNARGGISDAIVHSAFPIDAQALNGVSSALERHFGRKLNLSVQHEPELIGGIRVVVGDEVLDTSVKARLEQMKVALSA